LRSHRQQRVHVAQQRSRVSWRDLHRRLARRDRQRQGWHVLDHPLRNEQTLAGGRQIGRRGIAPWHRRKHQTGGAQTPDHRLELRQLRPQRRAARGGVAPPGQLWLDGTFQLQASLDQPRRRVATQQTHFIHHPPLDGRERGQRAADGVRVEQERGQHGNQRLFVLAFRLQPTLSGHALQRRLRVRPEECGRRHTPAPPSTILGA